MFNSSVRLLNPSPLKEIGDIPPEKIDISLLFASGQNILLKLVMTNVKESLLNNGYN